MLPRSMQRGFTFSKGIVEPEPAGKGVEEDEDEDEEEVEDVEGVITVDTLLVQYHRWINMRRWAYILLFLSEVVGLVCVAWPASLQLESGNGLGSMSDLRELQDVRLVQTCFIHWVWRTLTCHTDPLLHLSVSASLIHLSPPPLSLSMSLPLSLSLFLSLFLTFHISPFILSLYQG